MAANPRTARVKIFAVLVLYKVPSHDSVSLSSLLASTASCSAKRLEIEILIYDNTPEGLQPSGLPAGVRYLAAEYNGGLAPAYNHALAIAEAEGFDWLLTLDQDSHLPVNFVSEMSAIANQVDDTPEVAAIVPLMRSANRFVSPHWFRSTGFSEYFSEQHCGVSPHDVFAFNSGAVLRVTALRQVGGYDPRFWLDMSDLFVFRQLHRFGKRVFVAGNIIVDHDFSMKSSPSSMSLDRYRNILIAESAFWDLEMGALAGLERTVRLSGRLVRQIIQCDSQRSLPTTWQYLMRRLFWSRKHRLRAWEDSLKPQRLTSQTHRALLAYVEKASSAKRPKISVCMASYNGDRYIAEQLRSILVQLEADDEVVIVDDASKDRTCETVQAMEDPRIRLIKHSQNQGVVATFEEALRNATGKILFLSDNDDVWAPDKVLLFLQAFRDHPESQIVQSAISVIGEGGKPLPHWRDDFRTGFWSNVLRNHFQGSAMAIRASLLDAVTPFPKGVDFLHDCWIGTRVAALGGNVVYIDQPLLFYRRHEANFSGRMPFSKQVKARLQLLWHHLIWFCSRRSKRISLKSGGVISGDAGSNPGDLSK